METQIIVYIVIAAFVGLILGKIFFGRKSDNKLASQQKKELEESNEKIQSLTSQLSQEGNKQQEIKTKYEKLLFEANEQIKNLDSKLNAKIDESVVDEAVKRKLAEVATLKKRVSELEAEVSKAESLNEKSKLLEVASNELKQKIKTLEESSESLKKKVKTIEDENEEFEEEIDDLKSKIKKKDSEISSLKDEYDGVAREKKRVEEELNSKSKELDEKIKELAIKIESLAFVQEVLTAKQTSDTSIKNLYQKIDGLKSFIKDDLKATVTKVFSGLSGDRKDFLFNSGLESWAVTAKKSWIQGKTSIAFVGEFSAGKTSIVNRLLSQDDPNIPLLPVSTKATTAIPTYISGGVGTFYQFVTPNNELKTISEGTFKRVSKEVLDQVNGVSSLIQYFVMTYKNVNLDKLSILDTPGFNSNDKEDAERTIGVINECDALFWVFDVNNGTVNRSSIDLIKQHLKKPLYVVINKVDSKAPTEVDKVEALITKTLTEAGLNVNKIIRFSQKAPLEDMMNVIKAIPHDNQREGYLNSLAEEMEGFIKKKEQDVSAAKKKADLLLNKSNSLVSQYSQAITALHNDCVTASNIPQYNERWLHDNDYRMTVGGYNRLCGLLNTICTSRTEALCKLYDSQMDARSELEKAWNAHAEKRMDWQRLYECGELLNKKINDLRK